MLERLRERTTEAAEQRIARAVLRLAEQLDGSRANGRETVLRIARQDLAELSGATFYTVSRMIGAWERAGIVSAGRERIAILDPARLSAIASGGAERRGTDRSATRLARA